MTTISSLIGLLALVSASALCGCNSSSAPIPTPPSAENDHGVVIGVGNGAATTAAKKHFGMDTNLSYAVGAVVVEQGVIEWPKATADSTAEAGISETSIGLIGPGPYQIPISQCQFHTSAALTENPASGTSFATLSVYKRNNDGGTQTLLASAATTVTNDGGTGPWAAFTNVPIPSVAGAFVSPGDSVTFVETKTGNNGAIVPQGELACFTTLN
jgi:hypothetical protein